MRSNAGKNSYVDETLFGGKKAGPGSSANVISIDELRKIRTKTESNNQTDAVIISASEMQRIREATTIKSKDQ